MGINAFRDDLDLERGKSISPELVDVIKCSRFAIVVVSRNYAASSWCLDELLKIMECKDAFEQTIIPIFYEVDPSDVRRQSGSFGEDVESHSDKKKVKKWKEALTILAAISGEDSRNWRDESKLIKKIVKDISDKLVFTSLDDSKGLIGMSSHMDFLQSMMSIEDEDVRMVGIWGMGGVGKTTIAKYLYSGLSCRFQAHCFIENVKEVYNRYGVRHFTRRVSMQNVWRAFEGLSNLKLLNFYDLAYNGETRMHLPDGLSYLPRKLRSLRWDGYPLKSMPSRFHPEFLVEFCMSNSHLQKLWNGVQPVGKLKKMNLSRCKYLIEIGYFRK
ncbi:PREDICTED: disease resistance protein TAO1-like isoform X1 [Brassica oleracea var. oleracea]|uniref:disease resistance protein TAO1-like isoform X1 n=1 Tax=Brassica oleracea var. oleracea TaxID=109376 RepID=UPI0006A73BD6|nr:PREDICTED: disease resistance protein TAO1-like isoform X1 [Brassica oleracea var. oleracea]XP_013613092.1 PREDICTED: disease resistance protein TAO1-like isoform X1 [Brassica oleracea var. oleracea]XP_013613093.1 PREDICTED: disease resistance protein TAO1-like isoform X1 [Brassica oleracea var. oleracea]